MSKTAGALAAAAGCAIGFLGMALMYSQMFWPTCRNVHVGKGFQCSECGSRTDYEAVTPFQFCPICGAFVMKEREI